MTSYEDIKSAILDFATASFHAKGDVIRNCVKVGTFWKTFLKSVVKTSKNFENCTGMDLLRVAD